MRDMYSTNAKRCVIMPSYGMTECMPIAAPPDNYNLQKPGSSGRALGPELAVHNSEGQELPRGKEGRGHIVVRGAPCMRGYEGRDEGFVHGWFHTGDEGYLDEEGYLFIVGRSKEVINRGGETISPVEIEEVLLTHPAVDQCAVFATPHATLQEAVGVCVVPAAGAPRVELRHLAEHSARQLVSSALRPHRRTPERRLSIVEARRALSAARLGPSRRHEETRLSTSRRARSTRASGPCCSCTRPRCRAPGWAR